MAFPPNVWNQLKNLTAKEIIKALERDGWMRDITSRGGDIGYIKLGQPNRRVVNIHFHPKKNYGAKTLNAILDDIGWNEDDMRRLKLIK
jgi:predicted RNA binding protein YcfA (HicA-like mRNA interferase family)